MNANVPGVGASTVRLNRPPRLGVHSLGFGDRAAVWFQGCTLACPGCVSRDTWSPHAGRTWAIDALVAGILGQPAQPGPAVGVAPPARIDGLTVTGGEPFQQPAALRALLEGVREEAVDSTFDIVCFTGFSMAHLRQHHGPILELLDVVVDGRFVEGRSTVAATSGPGGIPRGSENQQVHRLTSLARQRYPESSAVPVPDPRKVGGRCGRRRLRSRSW